MKSNIETSKCRQDMAEECRVSSCVLLLSPTVSPSLSFPVSFFRVSRSLCLFLYLSGASFRVSPHVSLPCPSSCVSSCICLPSLSRLCLPVSLPRLPCISPLSSPVSLFRASPCVSLRRVRSSHISACHRSSDYYY